MRSLNWTDSYGQLVIPTEKMPMCAKIWVGSASRPNHLPIGSGRPEPPPYAAIGR